MTQPSPVITPEMFEILARRQSPCFESVRDDLVSKLTRPTWHPTASIKRNDYLIYQLWVCQQWSLGDFMPTVTDSEWREIDRMELGSTAADSSPDPAE